jgi:hypothetical protein
VRAGVYPVPTSEIASVGNKPHQGDDEPVVLVEDMADERLARPAHDETIHGVSAAERDLRARNANGSLATTNASAPT